MSTYYYQYQSLHFVHIKVFAWYLQELWNLATTLNPVYVQEPNFNSHFWSSNGNHVMSIWIKRHVKVFRRYPEIKHSDGKFVTLHVDLKMPGGT